MLLTIRGPDKKLRANNKSPRCDLHVKSSPASKSATLIGSGAGFTLFCSISELQKRRMASETSIGTGVSSLQIIIAHRKLAVCQESCYESKSYKLYINVRFEVRNGSSVFLRNVVASQSNYTASDIRRPCFF
jgi:hypothetical protein